MHLSNEQLKQYRDEGYVMLGKIMDDATLEGIRADEARFRKTPLKNDQDNPNARSIFRSQVCKYAEHCRNFAIGGDHISAVKQLVDTENLLFWYIQFITKFPDADTGKSEFPWHQDNGYAGELDPPTNVTVWVALDDVDEQNGCVWVMPKSHLNGVLDHGKASADNWFLNVDTEGDGIPAVMKAGEAVAFTGLTLHRSKLNHTDKPRRGFFMGYGDALTRQVKNDHYYHNDPDSWMVAGTVPPPEGKIPAKIVQA
ncbi:MAG: phytanoyl-CoA dioxygenase family protein [Opitutales bacterium]